MFRRHSFNLICMVFGIGGIIILAVSLYTSTVNLKASADWSRTDDLVLKVTTSSVPTDFHDGGVNIEHMLEKTRAKIRGELTNYNFTKSGVDGLDNLLLESGGIPLRSLIVSTWRSGSTFFGELVDAIPGNYYHYEPFFWYGIKQIRGPPDSFKALKYMKNLMNCNYEDMEEYFEYGKKHEFPVSHTSKLWENCKTNKELCYDSDFTSKICKLFPFQSMKVVRVRLKLVEELLEDRKLNLKVVLLVRDPRGVMQSRQHRSFCQPAPDCWWPELVCADMISDYVAASRLMEKYPNRIMTLRYEELALYPLESTQKVLEFLRLDMTPSIEEFLRTHTSVNVAGFDSTFRISQDIPFKWKMSLYFDYVDEVQTACKEAMDLWGYRLVHNASQMASKDFFPLKPYSVIPRYDSQR